MTLFRRLTNPLDRWLDFRSLRAPLVSEARLPGGAVPCLASQALERCAAVALRLDGSARLKRVAAPRGVAVDGAGPRWTFFFELPGRRAKLLCDWYLDGDKSAGRFGRECLDTRATPFPSEDSELGRAVRSGAVPYGRLRALWREERRRLPDLPLRFRDSDEAIVDLQQQGLRPLAGPFTLRTEAFAGRGTVWVAQAGAEVFRCRFA